MKMSDYILEQDISSASVMDIEIAQAYSEMAVATALMDCYLKQETIMEYASCDINEFGVFMEASTDDAGKPEGFVGTIKYWWNKLVNWIKKVCKSLAMALSKKSPKKTLYYLEKCPYDVTFTFSDGVVEDIQKFNMVYTMINDINDIMWDGPDKVDEATCKKVIAAIKDRFEVKTTKDSNGNDSLKLEDINGTPSKEKGDLKVYTKDELMTVLKRLVDSGDIDRSISAIKKFSKIDPLKKEDWEGAIEPMNDEDYEDVDFVNAGVKVPKRDKSGKEVTNKKGETTMVNYKKNMDRPDFKGMGAKNVANVNFNRMKRIRKETVDLVNQAVALSTKVLTNVTHSLNSVFDEVVRKTYKESKKKKKD